MHVSGEAVIGRAGLKEPVVELVSQADQQIYAGRRAPMTHNCRSVKQRPTPMAPAVKQINTLTRRIASEKSADHDVLAMHHAR